MTKGKTGFVETGEIYEATHSNEGRMAWLTAGAACESGDVMVLDSSVNAQATSTTTEADARPVVIVALDDPGDGGAGTTQSLSPSDPGWFQGWGRCALVNLMYASQTGDWLITSTTAKKARPMGDVLPPSGAFGWVLTSGSTPEAFLFGTGGAAKPAAYIVDATGGDYTSVVAAASALGSTAGAILVKAGTYTETAPVILGGDNQAIIGEKGAIIYGNHTLAVLSATGKTGLLLQGLTFKDKVDKGVDNDVIDLDGCTDFRIVDVDVRETYFRGINLNGCDQGIIRGCTFASGRVANPGMETSIYLDDCDHIGITGNIGRDQGYTDGTATGARFIYLNDSNYCQISGNRQDVTAAKVGLQIYHSHYNAIANNHFENNTWLGIGVGYASHFNNVVGNTCKANDYEGIEFGEANIGNVIANNVCTSATSTVYGRGIFMEAQTEEGQATTLSGAISDIATAATVADGSQLPSGNMLLKIGEEYVYFSTRATDYISGGVRAEAGTTAASHADSATITVLGPRDNIIEGNVCNWNKRIGIGLHHAHNCIIADNICINNCNNQDSGDAGIYLDSLTSCLVTNNRIADTRATPLMWHGITFSGTNTATKVLGNYITGAATTAIDAPDAGHTVTFVKLESEDWELEPAGGMTVTTGTGAIAITAGTASMTLTAATNITQNAGNTVIWQQGGVGRGWIGSDLTLVDIPLKLDTGQEVDFDRDNPNQIYAKSVGNDLILSDRTAGSLALSDLYQTVVAGTGLVGGGMAATVTLHVGAGTGIWLTADAVSAASPVVFADRALTAGSYLSGGGDLTTDRRFNFNDAANFVWPGAHSFTGAPIALTGATRAITWDTNDYVQYASNKWTWYIENVAKMALAGDDLDLAVNVEFTGGDHRIRHGSAGSATIEFDNASDSILDIKNLGAGNAILKVDSIEAALIDVTGIEPVDTRARQLWVDTSVIYPPAVYNVTLTDADTQYAQALPADVRALLFRCRTNNAIRYALQSGKVAGPTSPYLTLLAGQWYQEDNLLFNPTTLYLASDTAEVVVEIEAWS